VLARVTTVPSVDALPSHADLVVEAVPEDAALKARLLAAAEQAVSPGTVLASNTSSLSVTDLATALTRPDRFLGMHFFNPVPASELVEIVVAPDTGADTVEAALGPASPAAASAWPWAWRRSAWSRRVSRNRTRSTTPCGSATSTPWDRCA
jgi:3-hydroxyacyl-CoA dehydrogenase